jgi:hypothetical protein
MHPTNDLVCPTQLAVLALEFGDALRLDGG